ncbi:hypothetical protein PWT90_03848 [Aphanocladium album]|nr:hypothetical protein PWT90_03848 [Aphanocladium album]
MGISRILMATLPMALIVCSTILMLFTALSGVSHNELWLVKVDLAKLSINPSDISSNNHVTAGTNNKFIAADIGLADHYEVNVWGYCYQNKDGQRQCTKARYDWASSWLDRDAAGNASDLSGAHVTVAVPKKVENSLDLFRNIAKGAQVAVIVCLLALGATLLVGILAHFRPSLSGALSAVAWITVILVCAAAGLVSAMAAIIMDTIENKAAGYGVVGSTGTTFLAITWAGVGLAIAAAIFWLAVSCCGTPQRRSRDRRMGDKIYHGAGDSAAV